jgi:uncharacterized protein (TIGR00369 family)
VSLADLLERWRRGEPGIAPPIARHLGIRLVDVQERRAVFELDAEPEKHANPMGTVQGGVLVALADAAMGVAYATTLAEGESFTTLELKINYLKPVWSGTLTAVASVIKAGRTVGLTDCSVNDDSGSIVAYATSTCMTLRGDSAAGR